LTAPYGPVSKSETEATHSESSLDSEIWDQSEFGDTGERVLRTEYGFNVAVLQGGQISL
jgi:hypothetical protein